MCACWANSRNPSGSSCPRPEALLRHGDLQRVAIGGWLSRSNQSVGEKNHSPNEQSHSRREVQPTNGKTRNDRQSDGSYAQYCQSDVAASPGKVHRQKIKAGENNKHKNAPETLGFIPRLFCCESVDKAKWLTEVAAQCHPLPGYRRE